MDIKKEIGETISILSCISVSGDAVDYMAAARSKLKKIYLSVESEEATDNGGQQNTRPSGN